MNEPIQKSGNASCCSSKLPGMVCCLCICATICFVTYLFVPHSQPMRRLWSPVMAGTNGSGTFLAETRQLNFWTPSRKTVDYLHKENGEVIPSENWEVLSNDDAVARFGSVLVTNQNVLGYRRVEVWGQGRTGYKPGWWWTVNVQTNYTTDDLGATYQNYWKSPQAVFVEVIDNRGRPE